MPNFRQNRANVEIFIWIGAFVLLYGLASYFNAHEVLDHYFRDHESYNLDEVFTALNIGGFLGLAYSVLRIKDMSHEISRRILAERDVDWIAFHDPLTKLPNRRLLDAVTAREDFLSGDRYGVFSIDLDGFKKVNDLLGHDSGDAALKITSERLAEVFPDEHIYRLGGDEFVVLAKLKGQVDLKALSARIVRAISKPMTIKGATVDLGASVGYTVAGINGVTLADAIHQSDCAMYASKKMGRNNASAFTPAMLDELNNRIQLEARLRQAMREGVIEPYYQPFVELSTRKLAGFEALARWKTADGTFIPPSDFIPIAEDAGLIVELTEQLFRRACKDAMSWPADTILSFNVSPTQLCDRLLGLRLLKIMGESGLPVQRLEIEITESALIKDAVAAKEVLEDLTKAGIRIALDDFGTGYSSLSQLSNYQFQKIKIDRSFVQTFEASERQDKVVRAMIALGHGLGVEVTAEGIEEQSQLQYLQQLGCDLGQGYLFGRPQPIEDAIRTSLAAAGTGEDLMSDDEGRLKRDVLGR